jgi:hypothetical protein
MEPVDRRAFLRMSGVSAAGVTLPIDAMVQRRGRDELQG